MIDQKYVWKPIETAPKDGTRILLHMKHGGIIEGQWSERLKDWTQDVVAVNGDGWWEFEYQPTHWMSLLEEPCDV